MIGRTSKAKKRENPLKTQIVQGYVSPDQSQINYQVSFELTTRLMQSSRLLLDVNNTWHNTVLDEKSVDNLFESWKRAVITCLRGCPDEAGMCP